MTVDDPPTPATGTPTIDAPELFRRLGAALTAAGETSNRVESELTQVAEAYGYSHVRFFVLPTGIFIGTGRGKHARIDFAPIERENLRLDQVGDVYSLLDDAMSGTLPPDEGITRLEEILSAPPRYGRLLRLVGHVLLSLGLGLVLDPSPDAVGGYMALGALVGVLYLVFERFPAFTPALPIVAAAMASTAAFRWSDVLGGGYPAQMLIPPLITFLPGGALTLGTVEMATGSMIGGASRLVWGVHKLMLLSFGILTGAHLAGSNPSMAASPDSIGAWAPWVGVLVFGIGWFLFSPGPRYSLPWILVVLYATWATQLFTSSALSGEMSGFFGGLVLVPVAYTIQRATTAPPALVTFLPAFWLMVPGALGLTRLSQFITVNKDVAGLANLLSAFIAVVAIGLGVLVGSSMMRASVLQTSPRTALSWLETRLVRRRQ